MNPGLSLPAWFTSALLNPDPAAVWHFVANYVLQEARSPYDPHRLHTRLLGLDRLLAESAWELWERFPEAAPRTAAFLQEWWLDNANPVSGRAVMIMDALSLRELPLLLDIFAQKHIVPRAVRATAAEVPTETTPFARALNLSARSRLTDSSMLPTNFVLASDDLFTAVLDQSFADCVAQLSPRRDIVIWHSWLDDHLHAHAQNAQTVERIIHSGLTGIGADSLWTLVQALRQGRRLLITSDHGYANTTRFAHGEPDGPAKEYLQKALHSSRVYKATDEPPQPFVPPLLLTRDGYHVALGQRDWKALGGYPQVCHGGLSLLEAFVPLIELAEV
jgi:hypothetical protein